MKHLRFLLVAAALFGCSWCGAALAQTEDAATIFGTAQAAYQEGRYREAAEGFERAQRIAPHGATLFNAGLAWEKAAEPARAADALSAALATSDLSEADRTRVAEKLRALEADLATLSVSGPTGARVSVGHVERASMPAAIHVPPGTVTLRFEHDGVTGERTLSAQSGRVHEIEWVPSAPREVSQNPEIAGDDGDGPNGLTIAGWSLAGAGVAGVAVAIGVGVAAIGARDDWEASGLVDIDAYERARDLRVASNVTLGISAGVAALGGVLLIVGYTSPTSPEIAVAIGKDFALAGRW